MNRLALAAAVAVAAGSTACDQSDNDRPATLSYITEAILQPSCSQYVCHSSFSRARGYAFDTVANARASISDNHLVNAGDLDTSLLYTVLIRDVNRMPYDGPLPNKDVELIQIWIMNGADELSP